MVEVKNGQQVVTGTVPALGAATAAPAAAPAAAKAPAKK
jgi:hypothetical protein